MSTNTVRQERALDATKSMTLEVPISVAIKSAAAMLTSTSKDTVTPVLTSALFSGAELFATDRYKAVRFPMPTPRPGSQDRLVLGDEFLIPQDALTWVSKLALRSLEHGRGPALTVPDRGYTIRYERDPDAGTVTASVVDMFGIVECSETFAEITGNYPPIQRLFEKAPADGGGTHEFGPKYLGVILAYCTKHGDGAPVALTTLAPAYPNAAPGMLIEGGGATFLLMGYRDTRG